MISFLVFTDISGAILEVKWSSPIYVVSSRNRSFLELFSDNYKALLLNQIAEKFISGDSFSVEVELCLIDDNVKVLIYFLPVGDQLLIFGIEKALSYDFQTFEDYKEIMNRFMLLVKDLSKNRTSDIFESVRFQFESIQELNSELVNTRRLLEKTNIKLNVVNQDLNNRLVKDALTGLVSRYQYRTEIESLVAKDQNKLGVFTFMDIDCFKQVNDTYGHQVGDKYLIEFASRLNSLSLPNTIKMRISGDEFGLFSYGYATVELKELLEIWDEIKTKVMSSPIQANGKSIPISVSAGMAVYGKDTNEIYEIIEFADFAMYNAKRRGKSCFEIFDKDDYNNQKDKS